MSPCEDAAGLGRWVREQPDTQCCALVDVVVVDPWLDDLGGLSQP